MNIQNCFKNVCVLVSALGLALSLSACSTTAKNHDMNANSTGQAVTDADSAVQTQGIGSQAGFGSNAATNKLKAPFNQTYYFDFDKSDVSQDDYASIAAQAKYLVTHSSAKIQLAGNTDDRGSREYNIALGWRRAKAVQTILEQNGVASSQITTISYGAEKPAALGENEQAWQLNRHVDLVYKSY